MPSLIFRKGLDLKSAVAGELAQDYRSGIVDELKSSDFTFRLGADDAPAEVKWSTFRSTFQTWVIIDLDGLKWNEVSDLPGI